MLNLFSQRYQYAPVAQLDRVRGYEPRGREFESLRARHKINDLGNHTMSALSQINPFIPNYWNVRVIQALLGR